MTTASRIAANPAGSIYSSSRLKPVTIWASLGALIFTVQAYSMLAWALSERFIPTDPGSDTIPAGDLLRLRVMEACSVVGFVCLIGFLLIKPWLRDRRPSFDGLLIVCWALMVWQDPMVNYTSTQYLINSHLINFGSWTAGSTPGWTSPNGNLLPEPVLLYPAVYMLFGLVPSVMLCACWRRYRQWKPQASLIGYVLIALMVGVALDLAAEISMIQGGVFAYPNAIRSLSLWPGELHQFPLYEGLFVCFVMTSCGCLRYFVNDRGETLAERGIEKLQLRRSKQLIRFLAIYAWIQLTMLVLYNIPMQWVSTHTDRFVEGYPSYMLNGLCSSGIDGKQCPGKGVAIPRN